MIEDHLEEAIAAGAPDYSTHTSRGVTVVCYLPADLAELVRWAVRNPEAAERLVTGLGGRS